MKLQNLTHILIGIICVGLFPNAQALVPPPDGGYPNFTTAEGQKALFSLTTGSANTAVGWYSLFSNTEGGFNTATGAGALLFNNGDPGVGEASQNTAFGAAALLFNTTGFGNTAVGAAALLNNTTGRFNTATGVRALFNNTTGIGNTATGDSALFNNTTGSSNTANGAGALASNTTGEGNSGNGFQALNHNTAGSFNTANGVALFSNTIGNENTATGWAALSANTSGYRNTANGNEALRHNNTGFLNTASGYQALLNNTGNGNTALGYLAGSNLTTGDDNICIGNVGVSGEGGTIRIGESFIGATYIAGISGQTASGGAAVFVNGDGKLGTSTSSARFKDEIKPMGKASEALFVLQPVTFRYKKEIDPQGIPQFGLVAEDVEKVDPDLVVRDAEGKLNTVRYEQINAMLLNEFLKAHRRIEAQQSKIEGQDLTIGQLKSTLAQQQKRFESKLTQQEQQIAGLMTDLQRLAADIELNKTESRTLAEK
jgi:Chaperone of endosialidase